MKIIRKMDVKTLMYREKSKNIIKMCKLNNMSE